jgi:hypothetical protein
LKSAACTRAEPADFFAATDERLLKVAKTLIARLPFETIYGLIVEWIGKEISGAGMDPAVVGRVGIRSVPDPNKPFVNKLAVLGVTPTAAPSAWAMPTTPRARSPTTSISCRCT